MGARPGSLEDLKSRIGPHVRVASPVVVAQRTSPRNIRVPWPPTVNNYRAVVRNRLITSSDGRKFAAAAVEAIKDQAPAKIQAGRVSVTLEYRPPSRRRTGDIDNRIKPILDALTKAEFWNDDAQVVALHVHRGDLDPEGRGFVDVMVIPA